MAKATVYGVKGDAKHDIINEPEGGVSENCTKCHPGHPLYAPGVMMGRDLRTMHPISMLYASTGKGYEFITPPDAKTGWADVKLFNGRVECASCHDPHDPDIVPFLRKTVDGSALCLTCHIK